MATISELIVNIKAQTAQFSKDMGKAVQIAEKSMKNIREAGEKVQKTFLAIGATIAVRDMVHQFTETEQGLKQLQATINSTGAAAGLSAREVVKMAQAFEANSTFAQRDIVHMESLLLKFTKLGKEVVPEATQAILDMSAKMHTSLESSALTVGKALQDPINGISALAEHGIIFSASQKEVIKHLVETGQRAEAQRMILEHLKVEFGGAAAAARDTLGGALSALHNTMSGVLADFGATGSGGLRQAVEAAIIAVEGFRNNLDRVIPVLEGVVAGAVAFGALKLASQIRGIATAIAGMNMALLASPWGIATGAVVGLTGVLVACRNETITFGKTSMTVSQAVAKGWQEVIKYFSLTWGMMKNLSHGAAEFFKFSGFSSSDWILSNTQAMEKMFAQLEEGIAPDVFKPVMGIMDDARKRMEELAKMAGEFRAGLTGEEEGGAPKKKKKEKHQGLTPEQIWAMDPFAKSREFEERALKEYLQREETRTAKILENRKKEQKAYEESIKFQFEEQVNLSHLLASIKEETDAIRAKTEAREDDLHWMQLQEQLIKSVSNEALPEAIAAFTKLKEEQIAVKEEADRVNDTIRQITESTGKYSDKVEALAALQEAGIITAERYDQVLKNLKKPTDDLKLKTQDFASSLVTAFDKAIFQGEKLSDVFANLGSAILRLLEQAIILRPLEGLINGAIGNIGGSGLFSGIKKLFGFADGGQTLRHKPVKVGERGEEVFIPTSSGRVYPIDRGGIGGGGSTVINIIESPNTKVTPQERTGPDGVSIIDMIIEEVDNRIKSGRSTGRAIQETYGLRRRGTMR